MLESRTDYYRLLSEAFGPAVPPTREARKKIYDGARKALKEQAKLAPQRFDLPSEQRALEKAILDVEISAKLGQPVPRHMPGTTPPPSLAPFQSSPAVTPGPSFSAPASNPASAYSSPPASGPRIEWVDPAAIPADERGAYLPPDPPQPLASLPEPSPTGRAPPKSYQPAFLNRPDRVSYARKADPPPPPPPPPVERRVPPAAPAAPLPNTAPELSARPAAAPASRPPQEAINRIDNAPAKPGRKSFQPAGTARHEKGRSGLRLVLIVMLAACLGGAIAYLVKPEQLLRQLIAEFRGRDTAPAARQTPPAGAGVSTGGTTAQSGDDYVQLAIAQSTRRDYSGALASLQQAEKLGAAGAEFHQARAYAYWGSGDTERAIAEYGLAIRLDPGNAGNFANRAVAYSTRGEYPQAIRDLERAIAIDPGNPDHWNSRCWARALAGQLQEAIVDCNESLRLRPDDANTLDSRGFAYLKAGQNSRALADFTAVLAIAPQTASSLYGRGLARMRSGDRVNGANDISAAKAIAPNIEDLFAQYGVR